MSDPLPIPAPLPEAWASWTEATQRLWQTFWVSEFAHHVVDPTRQRIVAEDLFGLYDRVHRGERSYELWRAIGWHEGKLAIGDDVREELGLPAPPEGEG